MNSVTVCGACCNFFCRTLQNKQIYKCNNTTGEKCTAVSFKMHGDYCRYCRLKKLLQLGMNIQGKLSFIKSVFYLQDTMRRKEMVLSNRISIQAIKLIWSWPDHFRKTCVVPMMFAKYAKRRKLVYIGNMGPSVAMLASFGSWNHLRCVNVDHRYSNHSISVSFIAPYKRKRCTSAPKMRNVNNSRVDRVDSTSASLLAWAWMESLKSGVAPVAARSCTQKWPTPRTKWIKF